MSKGYRTLLTAIRVSAFSALLTCTVAQADDIAGDERLLCATATLMLCVEDGECFETPILDSDAPQFFIVDIKKKQISTTEASGDKRTSSIASLSRNEGRIFLQGIENNRAYSILIEEDSGRFTAAIARDGITHSVFGACTDAAVD